MGSKMNHKRARAYLVALFRGLRNAQWDIKSKADINYNCIAWSAGEKHRRWDLSDHPGTHLPSYWPEGVKKSEGIAYLIAAMMKEGFVVCEREEAVTYDPEFDTIVVYERDAKWEHAARLLHNGMWSSKIGYFNDIQHDSPEAIAGRDYGHPFKYMKRRRKRRGKEEI